MKCLITFLTFLLLSLTLVACTSTADPDLTAVPPISLPTPTLAPTDATTEPTATAVPTQPTVAPDTSTLLALVQADLPENAFDGLDVLPLNVPAGEQPALSLSKGPLWAV